MMRDARPRLQCATRQAGLSLVELIMFIVIVSVALAGVLSVLTLSNKSSADPLLRKQALAVAESMMEEVLTKDFDNPADGFTPATPGNPTQAERASFDDVSDYNMTGGWQWTGIRSLNDPTMNIDNLGSFTVQVQVAAAVLNDVPSASAKAITVTVGVPGMPDPIRLVGYRTKY